MGFIEFMMWLFGAAAIAIVFIMCLGSAAARKKSNAMASIPGFNAAVTFGGVSFGPGLALDPVTNRFAIAKSGKPPEIYGFDQLMAVEVLKDGGSVHKTNRGSQLAGAAMGGALLGPVGLLLGGVTGSRRVENNVSRLSLKIFTDDLVSPVTEVCFFEHSGGMKADSIPVRVAMNQLDEWHGRFQTILRKQAALYNVPVGAQPTLEPL